MIGDIKPGKQNVYGSDLSMLAAMFQSRSRTRIEMHKNSNSETL